MSTKSLILEKSLFQVSSGHENLRASAQHTHTLKRNVDSEISRLLKREAVMIAASTFMGRKAKTGMMKAITTATKAPVNKAVRAAPYHAH